MRGMPRSQAVSPAFSAPLHAGKRGLRDSSRRTFQFRRRHTALAVQAALAVCLAAGGLAWAPGTAWAQAGNAATEARRSYSIGAGPLAQTLNTFASQAGVELVVDASLLQGKQSPGLSGSHTVDEGFAQLLRGQGLRAMRQANGSYGLQRAPEGGIATLEAVRVSADGLSQGITEGTQSYTTGNTNTATKLNLTLRETPQTVTVVTRQKMDDFALDTMDEVLESTSTISIQRSGNNGNSYYSRGFALQSQYDGIPSPIGIGESNRTPSPDTAFLDKVEILQGASGLMAGAGEPGGTINLVRKRPTEDFQAHVEAQLGSWKKRRLVGDISGPLLESGKIRARAVAFVDRSDSFRDYVFDNRKGAYGVIEADLTDTTLVSASVMYQQTKLNDDYGVPMGPDGADLGLPRSSFYGVGNARAKRDSISYSLRLEQQLPADWSLKAAYTHTRVDVDKVTHYLVGTLDVGTGNGLSLEAQEHQRKFSSNVLEAYVSGPVQVLGRKHELVFGASSISMDDNDRSSMYPVIPINIYDFDGGAISLPPVALPDWPEENKTKQSGIYAATRLNIADSLKLILGTRVSWYEYQQGGVRRQKETAVVSPYAGLVYDLNDNYSVYASYSDIFKPQSQLTIGGGTVDPIVGKNYEVGIKGEFLNGRLNASVAAFRLEQTNLAEEDPSTGPTDCNGSRCYTASGLVVSQGLDLGINGELASGWQVGAGYTYVDSEYKTGANKGKPYRTYSPKHILRAYTTYEIPGTNWTVGGNLRLQSKMYLEGAGLHIRQGGYAVVGLMAKYQINKQAEVGLVVNNLFDRRYYHSVGSYGPIYENFYGAPRSFAVNLRYAF